MKSFKKIIAAAALFSVVAVPTTAFADPATVENETVTVNENQTAEEAFTGVKDGIKYVDGKKFTGTEDDIYYKDGVKFTGTLKNVYYKNGVKYTGVDDGIYYKDGKKYTGTVKGIYYKAGIKYTGVADGVYYKDGVKYTGEADEVYYKNGKKFTGKANGIYYKDGVKYTGELNGKIYTDGVESDTYIKIDGTSVLVPIEGYRWVQVKGNWYFVINKTVTKGWKYLSEALGETTPHWSFFDLKTGKLYTGWRQMGKAEGEKTAHWSYFGGDGWLRLGWQQLGKGTNNPDGNNAKHWSYFGDNGWLRLGWQQLGKGTNNPDGNAAKHWSYFGPNGWLRMGWQQMGTSSNPDGNAEKHWSYFGPNGWLRTEWQQMGEGTNNPDGNAERHWSYFGGNGWLMTNRWYTNSQGLHWFDSSGWLAANNPVVQGQYYTDTNGNGVLKKNTSKNGWYKWKKDYYWLVNGKTLTRYTGAVKINNLWYRIDDGKTNGVVKDNAIIAHATQDENGKFFNGAAGDQTKGEVCFKEYNRKYHWGYVIRAKDKNTAEKIASAMEKAVYNNHIGYDMGQRLSLYNLAVKVGFNLEKVTKNCETDCSAAVAVALRYAGFSDSTVRGTNGNLFVTATMVNKLRATGKFDIFKSKEYTQSPNKLLRGDILVLEGEHTAVVVHSVNDVNEINKKYLK